MKLRREDLVGIDAEGKTYFIGVYPGQGPCITCLVCHMSSFHPDDVRFRYCGRCAVYHDVIPKDLREAEEIFLGRI